MTSLKIALTAALVAFGASTAIAQTTPAPTAPAPAAKMPAPAMKAPATTPSTTAPATDSTAPKKGAKAPQSEISKACSVQADAQNLHGKPRKDFRKKCMKDAAPAKPAKAPKAT